MHFILETQSLGDFKIGPDPDGLGMVRIYSEMDKSAVQIDFEDIPDLIIALQTLQAWNKKTK